MGVSDVLLVGTSGFSYKDWVGSFYPEGTAAADMFGFYQENFDTVEIDYTYYSFPSPRTMASMAARAKDGFLFSVRTHKSITHDRAASTEDVRKAASDFRAALAPMYDSGKLACVLIQYPWSFRINPENVDRMLIAAERFGGLKVAVEFRNDSWANERMMKLLCDNRLALCCVDEPKLPGLFPPLAASTADFSYFRFHGRNSRDWWGSKPGSDRYDYEYTEDELDEWVPGIKKVAGEVGDSYIYMNNCHMGKAARNAKQLRRKLTEDA